MKKKLIALVVAIAAAGCASTLKTVDGEAQLSARALEMMKASFREQGQAKLDRLDQDEVQRLCSEYSGGKALPKEAGERIEKSQLDSIKYPAGSLLGDWKAGEKIAQSGVGKQYSDDPSAVAGGNCYACHQLTKAELAYGTIGPSLLNYGKLRGNSPDIQKYTYGKVYNADAYTACSYMPRFGHKNILTEQQIKDVVALLLDPKSPVNE